MAPSLANDLRSEARAYQRDKNHNVKWSRGATVAPGVRCSHLDSMSVCSDCATRPNPRDQDRLNGRNAGRLRQFAQQKSTRHASTLARQVFRDDVVDALDCPSSHASDASSGEEELSRTASGPVPTEADIMYSFDARTGPATGNNILSHAITKAVQRFENVETEKLIRREYDVIEESKEGYAADADEDDDFELIDASQLK